MVRLNVDSSCAAPPQRKIDGQVSGKRLELVSEFNSLFPVYLHTSQKKQTVQLRQLAVL